MTAPITPSGGGGEHTPTPWRIHSRYNFEIVTSDNFITEICGDGLGRDQDVANAAFIVEAVNSHATLKARIEELEGKLRALVEACTRYDEEPGSTLVTAVYQDALEKASAALASGGAK